MRKIVHKDPIEFDPFLFNGLIALLALSGVIARTTREYFDRQKKKA